MLGEADGHIDRIPAYGRDWGRGIEVDVNAGVARNGNARHVSVARPPKKRTPPDADAQGTRGV
jgi:hypothetical protein